MSDRIDAEVTRDALLGGRVSYVQPARGYRVCLEAPLLARFAIEGRTRPFSRAIDLGAGPGAVALCLATTGWAREVTMIEPDPLHVSLARRNALENKLGSRARVVAASVSESISVDVAAAPLVISNPPWFEPARGDVAHGDRRARARAFVDGDFAAFVRAARRLLGRDGRLCVAMPSERYVEVDEALGRSGLRIKRARWIHPRPNRAAQVVLLEAKPGRPGGLRVEPPIFVREIESDTYITETGDALWGRWPTPVDGTRERSTAPSEAAPEAASSSSGSETGSGPASA